MPTKDEFETTAQFNERAATHTQTINNGLRELDSIKERIGRLAGASEQNYDELIVVLGITMAPYDADSQSATFTPAVTFLGQDKSGVAATVSCVDKLPKYSCPPDLARKLREASNKGGLSVVAKLHKVRLHASATSISIPKTTNEKIGEGAWVVGLAVLAKAINPDAEINPAAGELANLPKTLPAYCVEITDFDSARYLRFNDPSVQVK